LALPSLCGDSQSIDNSRHAVSLSNNHFGLLTRRRVVGFTGQRHHSLIGCHVNVTVDFVIDKEFGLDLRRDPGILDFAAKVGILSALS
jgi:hypothetical protein